MSKLAVKTKGNSSPQGKPRVYFSCHPEDMKKCFDSLCQDIFASQNCAIYYESNWENKPDEIEIAALLGDMQLFVVPLTTHFLFHPCRAKEYEYGFAIKNHIPILPVIMEDGIDKVFAECMNRVNEGYGDIQFLNKFSTDRTEIPYKEKLQKQLDNILVGDELAERVRAAFDAYIFLSYRKKDRSYAKKLMKLIHCIPYCRDIAIWYDEFLVPGDAWNQAIREAMFKSKLMTLVVTPSIIESNNFIIQHEYPDAVIAGKEIIPAEVVATDHDALSRLFAGIPTTVDGNDEKALEAAFQSLAVLEHNHTSEHHFLIGLAYLSAIDVERDPNRAVKMITSAAEAQHTEAVRKLVSMYNTGEGVERNYQTAIQWQERLCEILEKENSNEEDDHNLMNALWDLGDMWMNLGQPTDARNAYIRMLHHAENRNNLFNTGNTRRDLSVSYTKLGNVSEANGNLNEAYEYYKKSLQLTEEIAEASQTAHSYRDLSVGYNNLGNICEASGDLIRASKYYENSLLLDEKLSNETQTIQARRDLSLSYEKMGGIFEAYGNLSKAQEYYQKSFLLREELSEETQATEAYRELSVSYNDLGGICEANGDLNEAHKYYAKSLLLTKEIAEKTQSVQARRDLSIGYKNLGNLCETSGDLSRAHEYFEMSFLLAEKLVKETQTVQALSDLSVNYKNLGRFYEVSEKLSRAREYYEKSLQLDKKIAEETQTIESRRDLSVCYNDLGSICETSGDIDKAREYYEKSVLLDEKLAEETQTIMARRDLAVSYNDLGSIYEAGGDMSKARMYYEKSLQLAEDIAEETQTVEAYDDLAVSYYKIGSMGSRNIEMIQKAYDIYCRLAEACPDSVRYSENRETIGKALTE